MAKANYRPAPEVKAVADKLIPKYHQHLIDNDVRVDYVFIDKTPKSKGREIWGRCRKVSGLGAFLANDQQGSDPFFVIEISEDVWDVLPSDKREALVDHELCHAYAVPAEEETKLSVEPHDLEEFVCIVRRHGLWRDDVEAFVNAARDNKDQKSSEAASEEVNSADEELNLGE